MSAVFQSRQPNAAAPAEPGEQMSFLEHLDEVRRRLVRSVAFVLVAFMGCWFVSDRIYNFLAEPAQRALAEAQRREFPLAGGMTGSEKVLSLNELKEGDAGRYVFDQATKLGVAVVPPGATVAARVSRDAESKIGLFTDEPLFAGNAIVPKGVRLPIKFDAPPGEGDSAGARMVVTTATESFTLYVTVSLYAAIALSVPFLLWQIWGFVSPGLYAHERGYATPFIGLSTVSFVIGAAFAYYVLFPPAIQYLLELGRDFTVLLRATDYFDFITLIMLAMGFVFQMPAITYVLARLGVVTANFLIGAWRTALIIILFTAALVSPTADIPNMMLFAAPMVVLYVISIFVAWIFGKKRNQTEK